MKKQDLVRNYQDIVEQFFKEAQHILYCQASQQSKAKMLHGAHYRATYYLQLNNHLLEKNFWSVD